MSAALDPRVEALGGGVGSVNGTALHARRLTSGDAVRSSRPAWDTV